MLNQGERNNRTGKGITKCFHVVKGAEVIDFYGVRDIGAKDKPFDSTFERLYQARAELNGEQIAA